MINDGPKFQFCVKCTMILGTECSFNKCAKCAGKTKKGK
jgi:hypothetical protein